MTERMPGKSRIFRAAEGAAIGAVLLASGCILEKNNTNVTQPREINRTPVAGATLASTPISEENPTPTPQAKNNGGGLSDNQTDETGFALTVIVIAALGVSASGLVAYRRQR